MRPQQPIRLCLFLLLLYCMHSGRGRETAVAASEAEALEQGETDETVSSSTTSSSSEVSAETPTTPESSLSASSSSSTNIPNTEESSSNKPKVPTQSLKVIELNARSFSKSLGDGNVWLIEFMAPWCSHCRSFETTYAEVAYHFHGSAAKKVTVAKVDGDSERALASRFGVNAYPSFFVIDGWSVYSFEGARSKKNLIRFVEIEYKSQDPIPFYSSPMGPMGLLQGFMMAAGIFVADLFEWLQRSFGLSPLLAGAIMFGSTFLGCFITIVILAIVITPKVKVD